ncbi:MAG: RT0821/Lpp0805 family surface protein [Patescibacteria group bacterium]
MKVWRFVIVAVMGMALLGGCANLNFSNEDQGMVIGGVLGGLGGSMLGGGRGSIVGAIAGTFAGGYLGREVGRYMDQQDKMLRAEAVEKTIVHGSDEVWENQRTGHYGRVKAGRQYQTRSGYCREYVETVTIDGRPTSAHGTACQERDGSWRIVNQ